MQRLLRDLRIQDAVVAEDLDATVEHGRVRRDHGICVRFANVTVDRFPSLAGTLDVHGEVFRALPGGVGNLAEMMLPLAVRFGHQSDHVQMVLGARRLSRGRLESTLDAIVAAGDPPFVFEIRSDRNTLLGLLPTRASLLKVGLENSGQSVRMRLEDLPRMVPRLRILKLARWWLCPMVFCLGCWALYVDAEMLLRSSPALFTVTGACIAEALPPHPTTMSAAFKLGQLLEVFNHPATGEPHRAAILAEAAALVGRAQPLTQADFNGILTEIIRIESQVSVVSRVRGFFTFVNTMWVLASLGIAISVGPSIYHVLVPIRDLLRRMATWVVDNVLVPTARRLHQGGMFEVAAFTLCWLLVAQGYRMPDPDAAVMVAFSGAAVSIPAFAYSTVLWAGKSAKGEKALKTAAQLWIAACVVPTAVHLQSTLLGYVATTAVFGALGFGVAAHGLCYLVGFDDEDAIRRCSVSSLVLVVAFTVARISSWLPPMLLEPFCTPVMVMGNLVLFLSHLIMSSRHYCPPHQRGSFSLIQYCGSNATMLCLVLVAALVGRVFSLAGMANVATTFLILWCVEKYVEVHEEMRWNGWLLILFLSLWAYRTALWLHANPGFIASLLSDSVLFTK